MSNFVNLLDIIYPVGSIYISMSSVSLVDTIGGTWARIEDKFLYGTDNTSTGGENTHILTISEMPSHSHSYETEWPTSLSDHPSDWQMASGNLGWSLVLGNHDTHSVGDNAPHNNMPAYQGCYIYHRTA